MKDRAKKRQQRSTHQSATRGTTAIIMDEVGRIGEEEDSTREKRNSSGRRH